MLFLGKHRRELYSSDTCPFLYINITHVFSPIRISAQKPAALFFPKSHTGGSLGKKTEDVVLLQYQKKATASDIREGVDVSQ